MAVLQGEQTLVRCPSLFEISIGFMVVKESQGDIFTHVEVFDPALNNIGFFDSSNGI